MPRDNREFGQPESTLSAQLLEALRAAGGEPSDPESHPTERIPTAKPAAADSAAPAAPRRLAQAAEDPASADLQAKVEALRDAAWAQDVRAGDPRFPRLPIPPGRSIADQASELLSNEASGWQLSQFIDRAEPTRSLHRTISKQSLEDQLVGLAAAASRESGNRFDAILARLGWLAADQATLEEAGVRIGVTRERMRQLQQKALKRIPAQVWLPRLDEALNLLEPAVPLLSDEASALLQDAGVTGQPLPPTALDRAARALRGQSPFNAKLLAQGIVYIGELPVPLRRIISLASKRARANGVASLTMLCAELASTGAAVPVGVLRVLLQHSEQIELLDDSSFCEPSTPHNRDRLENTLRRMLTVTPTLTVDSLLGGLNREYRYRNAARHEFDTIRVPSRSALVAYLQLHDGFNLRNDEARLVDPQPADAVLGKAEFTLIEVLNNSPAGVLPLSDAANACVARGMNRTTAYLYLRYLPTVEEPFPLHFSARGRTADDRNANP